MDDLERFSSRLEQITPLVGAALEADDVPRTPDVETPTLWLADVGHAVAGTLGSLPPEAAEAVFGLIEEVLRTGSEPIRTAVATGLLEALAGDLDRGVVTQEQLAPLLGPESRAYLRAWDEYTLGHSRWDADD